LELIVEQVFHAHGHEAESMILERNTLTSARLRRQQEAEAFSPEDGTRATVQMRQKVRDHEGQLIEQKARVTLFLGGFLRQLGGRLLWSWQA
jgi:hypothetical protein